MVYSSNSRLKFLNSSLGYARRLQFTIEGTFFKDFMLQAIQFGLVVKRTMFFSSFLQLLNAEFVFAIGV